MIADLAMSILAILGSVFILLASIGILRMPDLFLRLQVTSKASVLGVILILLAVAIHFGDTAVTIRVMTIGFFIVLTIPVATHMLARAGYATNVPLAEETVVNELVGQYDPKTHVLSGDEPMLWELVLPASASAVAKRVADLQLPKDVLIRSIHRGNNFIVPRGPTTLAAGDRLQLLASLNQMETLRETLGIPVTTQFQRVDEMA